jgi:hypothetical protein
LEVKNLLARRWVLADEFEEFGQNIHRFVLFANTLHTASEPNPPAPFPTRVGGVVSLPSPCRGGAGGGVVQHLSERYRTSIV